MSQVTQRQTKRRQPVLIDEDLAVFRFEGRNQLLRLWIKLLVQQVYDRWCQVPAIRRRWFRWGAGAPCAVFERCALVGPVARGSFLFPIVAANSTPSAQTFPCSLYGGMTLFLGL